MRQLFLVVAVCLFLSSTVHADTTYLPLAHKGGIHPCTAQEMANLARWDGKTNAIPSENTTTGCLLPSEGKPLDSFFGTLTDANVNAADMFITRKYAKHNLNCPTCTTANGVALVKMVHSARPPTMVAGGSWTNYWWGNGTTVFNNSVVTCQNGMQLYRQLGIGIGQGRLTDSIPLSSPTMYFIIASPGYCYGFTTYTTIAPQTAISMEIYRESDGTGWTARAWLGGWYYLFVHDYTFVGAVQGVSTGQEVGAVDSNFTRIKVPMNFAHKMDIQAEGSPLRVPWRDDALPTVLRNKSMWTANSPWNVMDLVGGDYTSISAEIN